MFRDERWLDLLCRKLIPAEPLEEAVSFDFFNVKALVLLNQN